MGVPRKLPTWFKVAVLLLSLPIFNSILQLHFPSAAGPLRLASVADYLLGGPPPLEKRDIFVFFAHNLTDFALDNFKRLERDMGADSVFLLLDDTKGQELAGVRLVAPRQRSEKVLLVNEAECRGANAQHHSIWWNIYTVWALVFFHFRRDLFQFLWFVEYDIWCHGSYRACLNVTSQADFLGGRIYTYAEQPAWPWWNTTVGLLDQEPLEDRLKSFFPLARLSKGLLAEIYYSLGASSGHTEVFVPTIARKLGYALESFPEEVLGYFEWTSDNVWNRLPSDPDNRIYHPVRQKD